MFVDSLNMYHNPPPPICVDQLLFNIKKRLIKVECVVESPLNMSLYGVHAWIHHTHSNEVSVCEKESNNTHIP